MPRTLSSLLIIPAVDRLDSTMSTHRHESIVLRPTRTNTRRSYLLTVKAQPAQCSAWVTVAVDCPCHDHQHHRRHIHQTPVCCRTRPRHCQFFCTNSVRPESPACIRDKFIGRSSWRSWHTLPAPVGGSRFTSAADRRRLEALIRRINAVTSSPATCLRSLICDGQPTTSCSTPSLTTFIIYYTIFYHRSHKLSNTINYDEEGTTSLTIWTDNCQLTNCNFMQWTSNNSNFTILSLSYVLCKTITTKNWHCTISYSLHKVHLYF